MSYSPENCVNELEEKFKKFDFSFEQMNLGGLIPIFFIKTNDKHDLEKCWMSIVDYIAVNFQVNLEDEYQRWNIYLFFITGDSISNALKYKIENDTFSSRKIVIDDDVDQTSIIKKHIINNDLIISKGKVAPDKVESSFQPLKFLWNILSNKEFKYERIDTATKELFNTFLNDIKEKNNEI